MQLEKDFHHAMLGIYQDALEQAGYRATRFKQLVDQLGGLAAAKQLLQSTDSKVSEGFTQLALKNRLDLSLEVLVQKHPWSQLFSESELETARKRLR